MYVKDFEYNGKKASEYNCIVGGLNGEDDVIELTVARTVNSVKTGYNWKIASTTYEEAYEGNFQIVKNPCNGSDYYFSEQEIREILKWLKLPRQYKKFVPIYDDETFEEVYLMAVFTAVDAIKINGLVVGFDCKFSTDAPYGYINEKTYFFEAKGFTLGYNVLGEMKLGYLEDSGIKDMDFYLDESLLDLDSIESIGMDYDIEDLGYEQRIYYPRVTLVCAHDGAIMVRNVTSNDSTIIDNCISGERIQLSGDTKQIYTDSPYHVKLYNDFNYHYPTIVCSEKSGTENHYIISNVKNVEIAYDPVIHITML